MTPGRDTAGDAGADDEDAQALTDPQGSTAPAHERLYAEAMTRLAAIGEEWAQTLAAFRDPGEQQ